MPVLAKVLRKRREEEALARQEAFENGFICSAKGNLWRHYDDCKVTIFRKGRGYKWCISDADGESYSLESYETVECAMATLWAEVE